MLYIYIYNRDSVHNISLDVIYIYKRQHISIDVIHIYIYKHIFLDSNKFLFCLVSKMCEINSGRVE